jgi:hypothetical protein
MTVCDPPLPLLLPCDAQNVLFQVPLVVQAVLALMVCPAVEESGGATQQVRGALFYCPAQARKGSAPRRDAARQLVEKVPEEREIGKEK